jgi:hypothetical protein
MNSPQSIDRIAFPEANWGQIEGYQDIKKRGASQAVAKLDFATHHPLPMTGLGGKPIPLAMERRLWRGIRPFPRRRL